jgi:hypothetical protein
LVDRSLDPDQATLFVIDGAEALRRAIKDVFGPDGVLADQRNGGPARPPLRRR